MVSAVPPALTLREGREARFQCSTNQPGIRIQWTRRGRVRAKYILYYSNPNDTKVNIDLVTLNLAFMLRNFFGLGNQILMQVYQNCVLFPIMWVMTEVYIPHCRRCRQGQLLRTTYWPYQKSGWTMPGTTCATRSAWLLQGQRPCHSGYSQVQYENCLL